MAKQSSLGMRPVSAPRGKQTALAAEVASKFGGGVGNSRREGQPQTVGGKDPSARTNDSVQLSMADHDVYSVAHAKYSKMDPGTLKAHRAAVDDVSAGLSAASKPAFTAKLARRTSVDTWD